MNVAVSGHQAALRRLFTFSVFGLFEGHLIVFFEFLLAQQIPWLKTHHICEIQRGVLPFFHSMRQNVNKLLAHLPSSSIAGTIFISQPSYEVKKSSGQKDLPVAELAKSIGIGIGFLSCIGIDIVKTIFKVLVLVLLRGFPKYWYWYC